MMCMPEKNTLTSDPPCVCVFCSTEMARSQCCQQFTQIFLQETSRAAVHKRWDQVCSAACQKLTSYLNISEIYIFYFKCIHRQIQRLHRCQQNRRCWGQTEDHEETGRVSFKQNDLFFFLFFKQPELSLLFQIQDLPDHYYHTLKFLLGHLKKVADHAEKNKVNSSPAFSCYLQSLNTWLHCGFILRWRPETWPWCLVRPWWGRQRTTWPTWSLTCLTDTK